MKLRGSLFIKVYLTLIASLALVAMTSAALVWLGQSKDETSWRDRREKFAEAMFAPGDTPAETRRLLERLSAAAEADIALYGRDGRLVASVGAPFPELVGRRPRQLARRAHTMVLKLDDGRAVAARFERPFGPDGRDTLMWLAAIALVAGIAAWPVVRHLTRRLERLRAGVEAWGGGALSLRVPDRGRDEVAAVARSFNRAAARIEGLVTSHRALLANASHELRSPLARLRMAIDLYEERPEERRKEEIVRNLAELDGLVDEILLASRLDHVGRLDDVRPVDFLALVAEEAARHGVGLSGRPATVTGDPRLLSRLVRNLMQNALRHGAPPVTAELSRDDGFVELTLRDHGPGIPDAEAERVFEPFYRPAGRSEAAGGWGLGLALVRQIAEHHGGSVRHERPAGGGAAFVVRLPADG